MREEPQGFPEFWAGGETLPTISFLNEAFEYDPETGVLKWRERPSHHFKIGRCRTVDAARDKWNRLHAGTIAAYNNGNGYKRVGIYRRYFYAHRIAWKMVTGNEPDIIDHINGNRSDNRMSNLRSCSQKENCRNQDRGAVGVYKCRNFGWYGQVSTDEGVKSRLFKTKEEAAQWRVTKARSNGYTARHLGEDR